MDNCIRCGQPGAENYMADYDGYLCDQCHVAYMEEMERFRKEFYLSGKSCDTCKYEGSPFVLPCAYCCRCNIRCSANMWEAENENPRMDNKEAIRRIREHQAVHHLNEPKAVLINEALDLAVEKLSEDEWIPVEENLPKKTGSYLVTQEFVEEYEDCKEVVTAPYHIKHGWGIEGVIAWKPKPAVYKRRTNTNA